jgi:hypothetical protein
MSKSGMATARIERSFHLSIERRRHGIARPPTRLAHAEYQ